MAGGRGTRPGRAGAAAPNPSLLTLMGASHENVLPDSSEGSQRTQTFYPPC